MPKPEQQQLFIPSALLAWVFPGLGYLHRGQTLRGLFVMVSVGMLMFVGVLVGGIQVCDATRNPVAGAVQRGSLPGVILNMIAAHMRPGEVILGGVSASAPALVDYTGGKPEEIGLIFTAVAGFLNLMAIVGSLTPLPKEPSQTAGETAETGSETGGSGAQKNLEKGQTQGGAV